VPLKRTIFWAIRLMTLLQRYSFPVPESRDRYCKKF
jgi:hypothetical protein